MKVVVWVGETIVCLHDEHLESVGALMAKISSKNGWLRRVLMSSYAWLGALSCSSTLLIRHIRSSMLSWLVYTLELARIREEPEDLHKKIKRYVRRNK